MPCWGIPYNVFLTAKVPQNTPEINYPCKVCSVSFPLLAPF
nr:MAG TPA: hypothetical protein [Caudoviricetes sp.]